MSPIHVSRIILCMLWKNRSTITTDLYNQARANTRSTEHTARQYLSTFKRRSTVHCSQLTMNANILNSCMRCQHCSHLQHALVLNTGNKKRLAQWKSESRKKELRREKTLTRTMWETKRSESNKCVLCMSREGDRICAWGMICKHCTGSMIRDDALI